MARNRHVENTAVSNVDDAQIKRNKPKDTKLRQQKLPAWQPILTAKTVIPIVFGVSALFIPIGLVLLHTSNSVQEQSIYYGEAGDPCTQGPSPNTLQCTIVLSNKFEGEVYFYYGLENYFQNHRRYMKSRSDQQLLGQLDQVTDCEPFQSDEHRTTIAPCGAIANSMFNDTFTLNYLDPTSNAPQNVAMTYEGLVWPVDKDTKFKNPTCNGQACQTITDLCAAFAHTVRPPNWQRDVCRLDPSNVLNSGFQNADFITWMRTAALPDFRKPYRRLDRNSLVFKDGLPAGQYELTVENNYVVDMFDGRKSFIISTTSWMGGKNPFLGIAYIAIGALCAVLGVVFILVHVKYGHTLDEIAGLNPPHQTPQNGHVQ